jgi:hypothetical protein
MIVMMATMVLVLVPPMMLLISRVKLGCAPMSPYW